MDRVWATNHVGPAYPSDLFNSPLNSAEHYLPQFGLPTEWVSRLVRLDPERRQVLRVHSCVAGSHAQQARNLHCSWLRHKSSCRIKFPVASVLSRLLAACGGTCACCGSLSCLCYAPAGCLLENKLRLVHFLQVLKDADMVLAINGAPVSSYNDVERIIAEVAAAHAAGAAGAAGPAGAAAGQEDGGQAAVVGSPPAKRPRTEDGGSSSGEGDGDVPAAANGGGTSEPGSGSEGEEAAAGAGLPEVQLTIFRDGAVQQVAVRWVAGWRSVGGLAGLVLVLGGWISWQDIVGPVLGYQANIPTPGCRLGREDGLGTDRLVHWCGAQLQVRLRVLAASLPAADCGAFGDKQLAAGKCLLRASHCRGVLVCRTAVRFQETIKHTHPACTRLSYLLLYQPVVVPTCRCTNHSFVVPTLPRSTRTAACASWDSCLSATVCTSAAGTTAAPRTATACTPCTGCRVRLVCFYAWAACWWVVVGWLQGS